MRHRIEGTRTIEHQRVVRSQHPYVAEAASASHVCQYPEGDHAAAIRCIRRALEVKLPPFVLPMFSHSDYHARVRGLVEKWGLARCVNTSTSL
jgi:hypothetical protein